MAPKSDVCRYVANINKTDVKEHLKKSVAI